MLNRGRKTRLDRKKLLIVLFFIAVFSGVGYGIYVLFSQNEPISEQMTEERDQETVEEESKSYVRLVATGDTIPHDALNLRAKTAEGYDYLQFMDRMQPVFDASDINFCNQAVLGGGEQFGIAGYPVFNSPTEVARDLGAVGCNLINTGSNHTNDLNQAAIDATVSSWDDIETLAVAGANRSAAERDSVRFFELEGLKFAFVSYTTYSNAPDVSSYGLTRYSEELARQQLFEAEEEADITIVSIRWGTEYSDGVNQSQRSQASFLTRLGADIILGHGPHVVAPVEKITVAENESYVWYSLGNFLNAQLEVEALFSGFAVMDIDKQSKDVSIGYLPIYMHYEWTPEEAAAEDLLARDNFEMYTLDDASDPLSRSQLNTSVERQRERLASLLNTYETTVMLTAEQYYK